MLGIGAQLKVFPDARIVHTHRNPLVAVPSTCSLIETFRTFYLGNQTYPRELGAMNLELWSIGLKRIVRAHDRQPESFYDVQFEDLNADPLGVVGGIYRSAGLTLKPEIEQKMKNW